MTVAALVPKIGKRRPVLEDYDDDVHQLIRTVARVALHQGHGLALIRRAKRHALRILTYHRFTETSQMDLKRQCEHLQKYYHPIALSQSSSWLSGEASLPHNSVVVTVDDGYKDFLLAHEVFQAYGIPVTIFIVTGFLDGTWLWYDRTLYAARHTPLKRLELALPGQPPRFFLFHTPDERERSAQAIVERVKSLSNRQRLEFVVSLPTLFEVPMPDGPVEADQPLSWSELRRLLSKGVDVGAHTETHPILSKIEAMDALRTEIEGPLRRIQDELNITPHHFCYPNGQPADFDDRCVDAVRLSGYQAAVTTVPGLNLAGADPFRLRRLSVEPNLPDHFFQETVAGIHA